MLQYILTGLAGIALGVAGMRIWMTGAARSGSGDDAQPGADAGAGPAMPKLNISTRTVLIAAAVIAIAAIGLIVFRSPGGKQGAAGSALVSSPGQNLDDVGTMIDRLAKRLEENPEDGEGFRMLGWSYAMTGHPELAIEPYKRARELLPNQANVHTGYGEALVGIAKDTVTPEAKKSFETAVSLDPTEPRARYFLALWKAQNGGEKAALDEWIALANEGPADAPWQADVRSRISKVSRKIGLDVSSRLKNAAPVAVSTEPPSLDASVVKAANQLPAAERQSMISDMVEGLAEKLKASPADADGWIRLMRSRMVLEQTEQAGKDLVSARKGLAGDAAGLARVNAGARELGVPGAQ